MVWSGIKGGEQSYGWTSDHAPSGSITKNQKY